ncbi:glycoside hydrolase family 28 protein [Flagellimonas maritima]|nr:glycoside hydrolase family 28 protein [Allomuricauda aurantiaca]
MFKMFVDKNLSITLVRCLLVLSALTVYSCKELDVEKTNFSKTQKVDEIIKRIKLPIIGSEVIAITDMGAIGDGLANCKPAISKAIAEISAKGGGKVVFPKGDYFCEGPIHLESNINLHFEEGSTLTFSQNADDYLPVQLVRWEGVELYNYSPYIYADNKTDIAITGKGKLNGSAIGGIAEWRTKQKPAQNKSRQMGTDLVPVEERIFGKDNYLRMSFIQLMNCSNILIEDITIENVPFWVIHPTYSNNITIRNVEINSTRINNDGIDLDSCYDALVENCKFNAGDDAIAIKSGRDQDAWRVNKSSKDIVVRNCLAENVLHGMAFGSEMSGGIENIYVENFFMKNVKKYAVQFKSNRDRGSYIRDVFIDGVFIDTTSTAVFFTNDYHSYRGGKSPSDFSDIEIKNLTCNFAYGKAIDVQGLSSKPIRNLKFENIIINKEMDLSTVKNTTDGSYKNVQIHKEESDFSN